jgi:hypothetical protein
VDRHIASPRIEPDRDLPGVERRQLVDDLGMLDGRAADDDAPKSGGQP